MLLWGETFLDLEILGKYLIKNKDCGLQFPDVFEGGTFICYYRLA